MEPSKRTDRAHRNDELNAERRITMSARRIATPLVALALSLALAGNALADEVKLVSPVSAIQLSAAGDSATVTLKDAAGTPVQVLVTDEAPWTS